MIRYFDTEAAYKAATKSASESEVSLIGSSHEAKVDGRNVIIGARHAKTGSIVVLDGNSVLHFVPVDSYAASTFPTNFYETVGVVAVGVDHKDYRGKIVIVHKTNASKQWSAIYSFSLTDYTLDGTDRTGILSVKDSSDWATNKDYTVAYNATTPEQLSEQLNTYFKANAPFTTQNWRADVVGTSIALSFVFSDYRQASNTGKGGFTLTANLLPGIPASSAMLRMNGQRSGEGTISNWNRALAYFRQDLSNTSYNPASNVTSPKRLYPICLPGYLGTSQYQSDHCAALRAIYGEGEAGWLKFMASFLPVRPTKYGVVGNKETYGDGERNTYLMAGKTLEKQDGSVIIAHPAADYCANVAYNHDLLGKGAWQLPDVDTLIGILSTIKYGTSSSRNADPVNQALAAIGGSAISNGSTIWSSSRYGAYSAWCSSGYYGYLSSGSLFNTYLALPVALLDVSEANSKN